jgi:hypothetical protein
MKKGLTHIIFIVDRSGSMSSIAADMIGGYNEFIRKQRELAGECYVSFYQFDDIYEPVFVRLKLEDVPDLDNKTYCPRNMTALYDSLGRTVNEYGAYLASLDESERPDRVMVITITDGQDNVSSRFTPEDIRNIVKHQTEVYNWDFVFLGSNIDAWGVGAGLGIISTSTLQFSNQAGSVSNAFASLASNTISYRSAITKGAYSFAAADYAAQQDFLEDDDKKEKNLKAIDDLNKKQKTKKA